MRAFAIVALIFITGCNHESTPPTDNGQQTNVASSDDRSLRADDQLLETLPTPKATDCAENDKFFADLMKAGYERVVTGLTNEDPVRDVAVWRGNPEDGDRLILTVSGQSRACRIVGMREMSGPAG